LPALAAFLRCFATKFSKQCLQYEWKHGNVRGSCSRSRQIEQQSRLSTLSTGILSGRAAIVDRENSHFAELRVFPIPRKRKLQFEKKAEVGWKPCKLATGKPLYCTELKPLKPVTWHAATVAVQAQKVNFKLVSI
jgi:hypothetical protein